MPLWADDLASLGLSLLNCQIGNIIVSDSEFEVKIKCINMYKTMSMSGLNLAPPKCQLVVCEEITVWVE